MATTTSAVPAAAAAVGYDTQTFGPAVTLGTNWQKFDFYGVDPGSVDATQNADGSVTIDGGGDNYGAQISTASVGSSPNSFSGIAFGGGGYFQATMSFTGPASFWANDIETMAGISTGADPHQWPGQAAGYGDWMETDFAEFDSTGVYGFGMHNWYGAVGSGNDTNTGPVSGSPVFPAGADYTQPNTYGFLWVPATATTQGYAKYYFNGVQIGNTITWNQYNPSAGPAPSISNGTAFSVLDQLHLALILGTGSTGTPNTVYSVQVWQKSAAGDISTLQSGQTGGGAPTPSANGTQITSASAPAIIDQSGNAWTLVQSQSSGLQIAVNGAVDSITSNVVLLETLNGAMVQENASGSWYSEAQPNDSWVQIAAPTPTAPVISSITTTPASGAVTTGGTVTLTLTFSETVAVAGGTPTLALNDGGTATYVSGSGSNTLVFKYTVAAGQSTSDLALAASNAISLNGATIRDGAGTNAVLTAANGYVPAGKLAINLTPSPDGTTITSASAAPIIDQSGNAWTLVTSASNGLQIAVNGVVDSITSRVVLLETLNGTMFQENASGDWYSESQPNDSWVKIAAPAPTPVTVGNGSDTLVLSISEDAWINGDGTSDASGDAAFTVAVDGTRLAGTFFAHALHSASASQNFTFKGNWVPGAHTVTVSFLNDAWGGTASTDRNLYVNDITYDGTDIKQSAELNTTSSRNFSVTDNSAMPPPVTGAGQDLLLLAVSEDYYLGNAQFTVSVDGKQLGGTFTATTLHSSGSNQTFAFAGDFGSGQHTVSVNFLNDAYAGSPSKDRNLYVNDVTYNGTDTKLSAPLYATGAKSFSVSGGTTPSVSETGDHGSLQKNLAQTGTYTVGGDSFVVNTNNAVSVTLGTGVSQITFIGASAVTLTGGSGRATVTADTGNDKFVAGAGNLDVTGGAGKDAYVFHGTSGLLTVEDFSLAKGDTLTIDKALQGSLRLTTDGTGGTLLSFGTGHTVDLHGVASIASSNILWT